MNVKGAWQMGYTGKGVVITILDDGIERDHPDLIQNYVCITVYRVSYVYGTLEFWLMLTGIYILILYLYS